jgi:tetratricopeptide (TPR) repeat protein
MAENREKALREAERLLKQGKVQTALETLRKVADRASRDPAVLNRIGDLLSMHGRLPEALVYYQKIAEQFAQSGFYPKAIAIYKKILRKDPERVETLVQMGQMYLRQKLPGEARGYLLRAGDQLVKEHEYEKAREIFRSLVESEPGDPRHRVRLAETLAAEGEMEQAGEELIALARNLESAEQAEHLEQVCRRAAELLPGRLEPVLGLISSFVNRGMKQEALEFGREHVERIGADPILCGKLAALYEEEGSTEEALSLLNATRTHEVSPEVFEIFFRSRIDQGGAYEAWAKLDRALDEWGRSEEADRLVNLLDRLAGLEEQGHVPALERLVALLSGKDGSGARPAAMERLVGAYRAKSMHTEAETLEKELADLRPAPETVAEEEPEGAPVEPPATATAAAETDEEQVAEVGAEIPIEIEAPAVPLNRSDEEFVNGRFTQAEILEKYGLVPKAVTQLQEVASRFPGHVDAQERLARLLRQEGQTGPLGSVLVQLAIARRAAGDHDGARDAVRQAREISPLEDSSLEMLERIGLVEGGEEKIQQAAAPSAPAVRKEPEPEPDAAAEPSPQESDEEIVIDFDADLEKGPVPEDLEEIRFYLEHGMLDEARSRLQALREGGFSGAEVDALEADLAGRGKPEETKPEPVTKLSEDDLSALTAALESEILLEEEEPVLPESGQEQSLEEVFAAFKEHVKEEVESDDFRTHYDLGIAYMEMGLIDEALTEFENAAQDADLRRQSCIMMAMCHRQNGGLEDAVLCYQRALESPGDDREAASGVRYDLAEVLLQQGDAEGALNLFRDVLEEDPTFRDVRNRVDELESGRNT